jgi:hypothetical protein
MDVELHQAFISHFHQERLAGFFIRDIGASHDFVDLERFLAKRAQYVLSIVQHFLFPTIGLTKGVPNCPEQSTEGGCPRCLWQLI